MTDHNLEAALERCLADATNGVADSGFTARTTRRLVQRNRRRLLGAALLAMALSGMLVLPVLMSAPPDLSTALVCAGVVGVFVIADTIATLFSGRRRLAKL